MVDALSVRNLAVRFSDKPILQEVSFEVRPGNLLGVLGPNGAGKTSLLRAIAGLVPYQGSIAQAGENLATMSSKERAQRVAYVPQRSLLNAPLSVSSVVAQGRYCHGGDLSALTAKDRSAIDSALQATDMTAFAQRPFTELSGGEQRRVLLARALATEAPVILLDEPIASLDLGHVLRLFQHMQSLTEAGRALVVVLHDLNDALRWCDVAVLIRAGRVVAQGAVSDVLTVERVRDVYGVVLERTSTWSYSLPEAAP